LFANGLAGKFRGQHRLHFGQGIEPGQQLSGWFAVVEAPVEFLPERLGQPGDFSISVQVHKFERSDLV